MGDASKWKKNRMWIIGGSLLGVGILLIAIALPLALTLPGRAKNSDNNGSNNNSNLDSANGNSPIESNDNDETLSPTSTKSPTKATPSTPMENMTINPTPIPVTLPTVATPTTTPPTTTSVNLPTTPFSPTLAPQTQTSIPVSQEPVSNPTEVPITESPTTSTNLRTVKPTTKTPTTMKPTITPTIAATISPTKNPTKGPTYSPTEKPTKKPTTKPTPSTTEKPTWKDLSYTGKIANPETTSIIYIIGDVPYNKKEWVALPSYLQSIPKDAEFVIHMGDIKDQDSACSQERYHNVSEVFLNNLQVPMLPIVADNEFNDCPRPMNALQKWYNVFSDYEKNWKNYDSYQNFPQEVTRLSAHPEAFSFVHKKTLFIGVNVPGGQSCGEECGWQDRMRKQGNWVKKQIERYTQFGEDGEEPDANGAVIFGHGQPSDNLYDFFYEFRFYVKDHIPRPIPLLYVCADAHSFFISHPFFNNERFLRIRIAGGVEEPPLRLIIDPTTYNDDVHEAYKYDRFWWD